MRKFLFISLILSLIFFTAFIKNSTKRIEDEIFVVKENIRVLKKDKEKIKLEHDYLSSTEKLYEFNKLYFNNELIKKNIKDIKIIHKKLNKVEIKQLRFFDE
tara:strand:+ start:143 stop:448 length:306 start_codon:yes stop_codon:yes gene_type:complete